MATSRAKKRLNPIYKHRMENRITRADFASKLGVSRSAVDYWENGGRVPDDLNMHALAAIMAGKWTAESLEKALKTWAKKA